MSSIGAQLRADRAIIQRQGREKAHEHSVSQGVEQFKTESKALWENRTDDVLRRTRVEAKAAQLQGHQKFSLQQRRQRLAQMLAEEQAAYEREMVEKEATPQQRMDKMAVRAYELKKKREDERKSAVQEKLYQQWREGIDELRTMDSNIVQLKVIADRDHQLHEKSEEMAIDDEQRLVFDQLWHEGYLAKLEREAREKQLKKERDIEQTRILGLQLDMKAKRVENTKQEDKVEQEEMKKLWVAQESEEKESLVREKVIARQERKKADQFMHIQKVQRDEESAIEKQQDEDFINGVLSRERRLAEHEEAESQKAKKKAIEFTEALKIEMAKKAQTEEELIRLQQEESERQYAKQYAKWEKEEFARRGLMEEVYNDRAQQVQLKQEVRGNLKAGVGQDRSRLEAEVARLEAIEKEREAAEAFVKQRHQEELFRQMDFHQVSRHRHLQHHAIEQRQAAIAEEKIRRAVKVETSKAGTVMNEVLLGRVKAKSMSRLVSPWAK